MQSDAGDRYDGCWRDNLMQGEGTLFLANGDVYDGMFDKGKKNGHGTMTYLFAPGVHAKQYVTTGSEAVTCGAPRAVVG